MNVIYWLDLIGTFAFAISGTLSAAQRRFDIFGALFIGTITAIGGGTVRDALLGSTPVAWLLDINYFYTIFIAVLCTFIFKPYVMKMKKTLFLFDTIGIGVFTIIGLEKALMLSIPAPQAIMMGISTAVVGGVLRDVFCNEIPLIFHREIYATACILGAASFIIMQRFGIDADINSIITTLIIILIRTLSVQFNWSLPHFNGLEPEITTPSKERTEKRA